MGESFGDVAYLGARVTDVDAKPYRALGLASILIVTMGCALAGPIALLVS